MNNTLETRLLALHRTSVLHPEFSKRDYIPIDLSVSNKALETIDTSSSVALGHYINHYVKSHQKKVAFGGYIETRNIYNRSTYFKNANAENERNVHLGLDLWIAAETPVFTPLDAEVHSFNNNINFGDYGPTIILKHRIDTIEFYTLYGHLSLASIADLKIGQQFQQGQQIGTLGEATVNGDYAPHLHFQVIKDMQDYHGDYPGVCSKQDLEFYKENCPDPNMILKL